MKSLFLNEKGFEVKKFYLIKFDILGDDDLMCSWVETSKSFGFHVIVEKDTFECFGIQLFSILFWDMHVTS